MSDFRIGIRNLHTGRRHRDGGEVPRALPRFRERTRRPLPALPGSSPDHPERIGLGSVRTPCSSTSARRQGRRNGRVSRPGPPHPAAGDTTPSAPAGTALAFASGHATTRSSRRLLSVRRGRLLNATVVESCVVRTAAILVVDDEARIRRSLAERLTSEGHRVLEAETGAAALEHVDGVNLLVLLDDELPDIDAVTVLRRIHDAQRRDTLVILLTACGRADRAVEAMKLSARRLPPSQSDLDENGGDRRRCAGGAVARTAEAAVLQQRRRGLLLHSIVELSLDNRAATCRGASRREPGVHGLADRRTRQRQRTWSRRCSTVGHRSSRPFLDLTCSARPDQLLECELFGRGPAPAPTPRLPKRACSKSADGSPRRDERDDSRAPAKLRFLEDTAFEQVGGAADVHVDVRVVAVSSSSSRTTSRRDVSAAIFFDR